MLKVWLNNDFLFDIERFSKSKLETVWIVFAIDGLWLSNLEKN